MNNENKSTELSSETDWEGAYLLMQEKFIETHKQLLSLKSELAAKAGLQWPSDEEIQEAAEKWASYNWPGHEQEPKWCFSLTDFKQGIDWLKSLQTGNNK